MSTNQDRADLLRLTKAVKKLFTVIDERHTDEAIAYGFELEKINNKIMARLKAKKGKRP